MGYVLLLGLLLAAVFGPGLWVKRVMSRYSEPADRYPVTGAQLARRLLDDLRIEGVGVERTEAGDHYDPEARAVRLSPAHYDSGSLTAVTVAAHEVGHALQHATGYGPLVWRGRLVRASQWGQRVGAGLLLASPLVFGVTRAPAAGLIMLVGGFLTLGLNTVVHLATLPTEYDASFRRALPVLESGGYLRREDRRHARKILKAAALTYVGQSLMSLLNVWAWIRMLRP